MAQTSLVPALRSTWRKSAQHAVEQLTRFVRLTALSAVPSLYDLFSGGKFDWRTLLAFIVPFAEVAWRQVFPALGAAAVDAAPGAAIVPAEVDAPVDPATGAGQDPATGAAAVDALLILLILIVAFSLFGALHSAFWLLILVLILVVVLV